MIILEDIISNSLFSVFTKEINGLLDLEFPVLTRCEHTIDNSFATHAYDRFVYLPILTFEFPA